MDVMSVAAPTTADAQSFWRQACGDWSWKETYDMSASEPSRDWAIEGVLSFGPDVRTVLELGCHCGPLLKRLAALPGMTAAGLDVNTAAVCAARLAGLDAVVGAIPEALLSYPAKSVDVIVTSYCLAYIAPEDLPWTLAECLRIARRGLVLVEESAGPGVPVAAHQNKSYCDWRHEYLDAIESAVRLLGKAAPAVTMTRTRKEAVGCVNAVIVAEVTWPS